MNEHIEHMSDLPPVALFIFNRPQTTQKVFDSIREAEPPMLFLIADGPRKNRAGDLENCNNAREITESIDWDCQVFRNFSEENLGCKRRVASGISWVFEHVDRAIILEDDCLPHPSFFYFCGSLLERYQNDKRIMAISGDNFQFGKSRTQDSYYLSRYPHCWGWATWKRAWQHYDIEMRLWPEVRDGGWLRDVLQDHSAIKYWHHKFQQTYDGKIDTWDYAWVLCCWIQSGLCILPNENLISNIGFDANGTHHFDSDSPFAGMSVMGMSFPLRHPSIFVRDAQADRFTQSYQFGLLARSRRKLKVALGL